MPRDYKLELLLNGSGAIEGLEKVRKGLCLYMGPTCDCKFMSGHQTYPRSEQTGCCEIRKGITVIEGLLELVAELKDRLADEKIVSELDQILSVLRRRPPVVCS